MGTSINFVSVQGTFLIAGKLCWKTIWGAQVGVGEATVKSFIQQLDVPCILLAHKYYDCWADHGIRVLFCVQKQFCNFNCSNLIPRFRGQSCDSKAIKDLMSSPLHHPLCSGSRAPVMMAVGNFQGQGEWAYRVRRTRGWLDGIYHMVVWVYWYFWYRGKK